MWHTIFAIILQGKAVKWSVPKSRVEVVCQVTDAWAIIIVSNRTEQPHLCLRLALLLSSGKRSSMQRVCFTGETLLCAQGVKGQETSVISSAGLQLINRL